MRTAEREPWTVTQAVAFLDYAHRTDDRLADLFEVIIGTGLRRGEALALHWSDVNLEARVLFVHPDRGTLSDVAGHLMFTAPKTKGSAAGVGLSARVVAASNGRPRGRLSSALSGPKVFLSWSGERSRLVAAALCEWLPQVINAVEPFISSYIDAGVRWLPEVATELQKTNFGILCVRAENQRAPWLNFEAGALAKAVDASRVIPLDIDLSPVDIQHSLGQFQVQQLTQVRPPR